MINEDHMIQSYIEENRIFLKEHNIEIAHSDTCGDWFIYEYNKDYHYYEYFIKFTSVSQLKTVVEEELRFKASCKADEDSPVPTCEADSFAEDVTTFREYKAQLRPHIFFRHEDA